MAAPKFLLNKPEPTTMIRLFAGRPLQVWYGKVKVENVDGWVDNPRIELAKKERKEIVGDRELTQDEIFDIMRNTSDFKLKDLRDDILRNGLREPIVLTFSGKLLDGNRRFFSVKYAIREMDRADPRRTALETVSAYVLTEDATEEDERHVLVEENFSPSLKLEWDDYVKAEIIKQEADEGMNPKNIAKKYNWKLAKVKETLKIWEIIDEFLVFATDDEDPEDEFGGGLGLSDLEAEKVAAQSYQYFNEAQKSFFNDLKSDYEFKAHFYRWIKERKFRSFPEVRIAFKAWNDPDAKPILMRNEPTAAKDAKAIIDYKNRIDQSVTGAQKRVESFIQFLRELKAEEIKQLPDKTRESLKDALELITSMSEAASA